MNKIINTYHSMVFFFGLAHSFFFATYVLFLLENGLDLFEVGAVNSIYMLACFFLEMPTGSFADTYGRKKSFVVSCFLYSLSMFVYFKSSTFSAFAIAEIIGALAFTFYSGAFKAWMVDSVNHIEPGFDLKPVFRKALYADKLGVVFGAITGAYVGKINLALPWLMSSLGMLLVGILALGVIQEKYFEPDKTRTSWEKFMQNIQGSIRHGYQNKAVFFSILLAALFGFACVSPNMYWQVIVKESLNVSPENLGWVFALIKGTIVLGTVSSSKVLVWLEKSKTTLLFAMLLFSLGLFMASVSKITWVFMLGLALNEFSRGIYTPINEEYINRHIKLTTLRSSVLSFDSMISRLGGFLGLIIGGLIARSFSPEFSWLIVAMVVFVSLPFFKKFKNGE